MRQSKTTETQIVNILQEAGASCPVNKIRRRHDIRSSAHYNWFGLDTGRGVTPLAAPARFGSRPSVLSHPVHHMLCYRKSDLQVARPATFIKPFESWSL